MLSYDAKTMEIIFEKPLGKVLTISNDTFYKSYYIIYNYNNEGVTFMKFDYLKSSDDGMILMQEESMGVFSVQDAIKQNGVLLMIKNELIKSDKGDSIMAIKITGIKS